MTFKPQVEWEFGGNQDPPKTDSEFYHSIWRRKYNLCYAMFCHLQAVELGLYPTVYPVFRTSS